MLGTVITKPVAMTPRVGWWVVLLGWQSADLKGF
jgi:hypothetical protein